METESSKELLNHPLAIVALLSVIFGFLTMALDKFFYFMRGVNKTTPMDKMAGTFEKLEATLQETTRSLQLLNQKIEHSADKAEIRAEQILSEVRGLRKL